MMKLEYLAVNSKIHSLQSYLLNDSDYNEMLQKNSVPEIARYLKDNTVYFSLLKNIEPEEIHRRDLEVIVKQRLMNIITSLIHYLLKEKKKFVIFLLKRFEVENLKYAIRNALIEGRKCSQEIEVKLYNLGKYSSIDFKKIINTNNTDELLNIIQDSQYYEVIRNAISTQSTSYANLIHLIENALDTYYELNLQEMAKNFNRKEYRIIMSYVGTRIDLKNMEWIVRSKMFYELSPEELYNSLIHIRQKLSFDYLRMACDTKNPEEAIDFFRKSPYSSIFENLSGKDLPFELAKRIDRYFYRLVVLRKIENEFTIGKLLEFLYLVEYESEDIIRLVEAVRYSIESKRIPEYLIRELRK